MPDYSNANSLINQNYQRGLGAYNQSQNLNLFDPDTMGLIQRMLQPLFNSQRGNLLSDYSGVRGRSLSDAGNQAGAVAGFRGYDPGA